MSESTDTAVAVTTVKKTFNFTNRMNLTVLTGRSARDLAEFLEYLKIAPGSVIYHHTHHFIQQHQYLSPEPPNDFAYWVTNVLQENILGEQLAAIDVIQFPTIRSLQERLVKTIENYMNKNPNLRTAPAGEEFNFMRSITFILPTHFKSDTLLEFRDAVKEISVQSLYFHIFEARLRIGRISNDFSLWLEGSLGEKKLAQSIASLDPYTHTLEGLRQTIVRMTNKRLEEIAHA